MKKATLLCGMLLALTATVASAAQGTNLRWLNCIGDLGVANRNFACGSNTGNHQLVGSIELGAPLANVSGHEIVLDIASSGPVLPAWWQMVAAGTCRQSSLSFNTVISGAASACLDWGNGASNGGIGAYNIGIAGPNTARLVAACAVPPSALAALEPAQEYFIFNVLINSLKTVGTGACAGCSEPVCIVYNSDNCTTPILANDRKVSGATNGTDSNFVTWQGGGAPQTPRGSGCPAATPTKNATWGTVKSLYR